MNKQRTVTNIRKARGECLANGRLIHAGPVNLRSQEAPINAGDPVPKLPVNLPKAVAAPAVKTTPGGTSNK